MKWIIFPFLAIYLILCNLLEGCRMVRRCYREMKDYAP